MTDDRFFHRSAPIALGEIAAHVGGELDAPALASFLIEGVAALDCAKTGELSVFSDGKRTSDFAGNHATVVVTSRSLGQHDHNGSWLLIVKDPRLAFAKIGHLFYPAIVPVEGTHRSAHVDSTALVGMGTQICSGAVLGRHTVLGENCRVGNNVVIGDGVVIGNNCSIDANSVLSHCVVGSRVKIESNVSIGGEGFGFVPSPTGLMRIPQLGRVIIGDDVQIGSNCTFDRGAIGDTVVGAGSVFDNLVHVAHNVHIGRHCVFAAQVGIAGSTTLGDRVMVGGQTAINDHVTIGSDVRIAGRSGVMRDLASGEVVGGVPAMPIRQWHRQTVALAKLSRRDRH